MNVEAWLKTVVLVFVALVAVRVVVWTAACVAPALKPEESNARRAAALGAALLVFGLGCLLGWGLAV